MRAQVHEHFLYHQLRTTLKESGQLRDEVLLDHLEMLASSTPAKFSYFGSLNAFFVGNASSFGSMLLIKMPDLNFVKLSMTDLKLLVKAEPDSEKFAALVTEIASRYHGAIQKQ